MAVYEILNITSYQALFFALLVLLKKHKNQSDWFLVLFFVLHFIMAQDHVLHRTGFIENIGSAFTSLPIAFMLGPVLYLYILSHIQTITSKYLYHFIPAMLSFGVIYFFYYQHPIAVKTDILLDLMGNGLPLWLEIQIGIMIFIMLPFYIYSCIRSMRQHKTYALMRLSYTENVSLAWLNRFIWIMIGVWIALLIGYLANKFTLQDNHKDMALAAKLLGSFGHIYLGIYGIRNNIAFSEVDAPPELEPEPIVHVPKVATLAPNAAKLQLEAKQIKAYEERLLQCMEEKKPYLNPKLSLKDLAARSDIPYYHLSMLLNQHLDATFYDFVNRYRVEEFINLYQDSRNDNFTLLSLAYDAGFNSKSTFYTIFKKFKGASPSSYFKTSAIPVGTN